MLAAGDCRIKQEKESWQNFPTKSKVSHEKRKFTLQTFLHSSILVNSISSSRLIPYVAKVESCGIFKRVYFLKFKKSFGRYLLYCT